MKQLAVALFVCSLALALVTAGARADQTFWTIEAGPSMPPAPSPWPVSINVDYLTYACDYRGRRTACFCEPPNGYDTRRRCYVGHPPRPPYPPRPRRYEPGAVRQPVRPLPPVRTAPPAPIHS